MKVRPSIAEQRARQRELDQIRFQRALTPDEIEEANRLTDREHMRQWRAVQRSIEIRLGGGR